MLLLDTATVPRADRAEAFHHALTHASVPNRIVHEEPGTGIQARMDLWRIGALDLFTSHNTGFKLTRTARHVRQESRPIVAVALQNREVGRAEIDGKHGLVGPDDVYLFNEMTPREFGWTGKGAAQAILIDFDRLGLPMEILRNTTFRLRASPLHDVVLQHVRALWRDPDRLAADPGAPALANATIELIRALVVSASQETGALAREIMDDTQLTRMLAYARRHLTDRNLDAELIANEHAISVRHLYETFQRAGLSLEQWIISERLEGARNMLASPHLGHPTIAAVARRWGFASPGHFSRRFRAAYGMTPSEWRRLSGAGGTC
ncbi:helix-turn-helix domain-containing protein [Streptomyces stelliscabiei]|uniref:helix-turn-helix domain-containing protein n=1 Tax=Streptomyces stelliscabiei TaxID=146820 RepID=UPI0029B2E65D|nr:helix-turn-helix domain-containing protein [Streptomyces stelliscabiei]MDX2550660.1 helix-turn-helix domain-containing protein [Streptomyces stelliscabiei]MDX2610358.1 helix-turn-helix domain-containing protein [Streptomyces stelliscabiei]MDX2634721.1 helix-turn-helix domain-containing protein [Streptomyces stelliscabiei]MDX2659667.1 helix-turn-helix domain-containing protein [Streptomyces stelliscabiei]MDX2715262.1 helix-turn-helix domain-containing protein [Streptomyces stelliscabiei]